MKLLDSSNPSANRKLREILRNVRYRFKGAEWVNHPNNIQIDTHNYCNLWLCGKGCIHCNVKPSGNWKLKRAFMPDEMIEYIINYWKDKGVKSIAPYINGEPLLDERMSWIFDLTKKAKMHVEIDTNGTIYDRRTTLIHEALKQVRFSYSAITPEVYELVHGADLFKRVTETINFFLKNRKESQYPMLYFITNKYNKHELLPYIKKWSGKAHLVLFPLHEVGEIQQNSIPNKTEKGYWNEITKVITGKYPVQENRPIDIYPNGFAESRLFNDYEVCQGSHSFSISCHGDLLHCTDIPYSFNYGKIYENDMLKVWHIRNLAKINHVACNECNVRRKNHDELLKKYLKVK